VLMFVRRAGEGALIARVPDYAPLRPVLVKLIPSSRKRLTSFPRSVTISSHGISDEDINHEECTLEGSPGRSRVVPAADPAVLYILVALAEGERHGYAIMQEVTKRSGGAVRLGPGTLYGAISRMLKEGLIEESEERPAPEMDDTRRRHYRLSHRGGRALAVEAKRLGDLARLARSTRAIREVKHA
jgi:DNA-binding PadR family transcriptional regulator